MLAKTLITIAVFILAVLPTLGEVEIPTYQNYITDISTQLDDSVEAELNQQLATYESTTGTEIAVLIVPLIPAGLDANTYATMVGNKWGIGKVNTDNGALLLIETDDAPGKRDIYIATGSQLEGGLADLEANYIVNDLIIPEFRVGDFDAGVRAGVNGIIAGLDGEVFAGSTIDTKSIGNWFQYIFMFIFFVLPWFGAIFGRSKAIWPGGAVGATGGVIFGWVSQLGLSSMLGTALAFGIFGFFLDWLVSSNYEKAKKTGSKPSWWAGGRSGGSSRGGGFGGFGGGGFSGGGSGGSW